MARVVILYAAVLALVAALMQWLEYRYFVRSFSTEIYIVLIAAAFAALGLWAGRKLTPRSAKPRFERNRAAIRSLGLTDRECEILERLASGRSNKELARELGISPNTVKTHVARVYEKLEVQKRVQAIEKARWLSLIPGNPLMQKAGEGEITLSGDGAAPGGAPISEASQAGR